MFYAGIDMLFSILFPILFLVVLGMILFAIPVTESSASRPTAPGRRDIPSTFWMRSLIKLSARFSPR